MQANANEDDDEDSGDELQHASVESANTSDDWRLLVMDLDDALAKLEQYIKQRDAQQTPTKSKRDTPSALREVCSLVDTLIRQHTKCNEEGECKRVWVLDAMGNLCFEHLAAYKMHDRF